MADLVSWLSARYDEAERAAKAAAKPSGGRWQASGCEVESDGDDWQMIVYDEGRPNGAEAEHIAAHDPSWRLADIGRKRAILAECVSDLEERGGGALEGMVGRSTWVVLCWLAAEFAGWPGYDEAWRPE